MFYQKFWHIIGPTLITEVQNFFRTGTLPTEWNLTHLCLIPKVKHPILMSEMRSISLCLVHYKIISKIMCGRLKRFIPEIISDTPGAVVADRSITDNILVAHKIVHALRTHAPIVENFMVVKTDMLKAYDRIEWCFIEKLLEKMRFDNTWIWWTMKCVKMVTYTILLNGHTHGFIKPGRGIRQGDLMSHFLFILCAEALVHILNKAEAACRLNGIQLSVNGPSVYHLLFTDDSLLMCQTTVGEATKIIKCLKVYEKASRLVINRQKSSIIFGNKVAEGSKQEVKRILRIDKEGGEGKYLGLPECFSGSKRQLLNFIQRNFSRASMGGLLSRCHREAKRFY